MAQVTITAEALSQLDGLPAEIVARMEKLIERLKKWPNVSGVKPLRGNLAGRHRMRTGDYRLQFCLREQTIVIERIGHRDGFYEG
ncbi:MAG TPA: type II toxin-antitoxin system RelE/ParE family toxin [Pirellulales bacterium]|jgi:mRNA-degrading endonuclease RelE of RelBE toxin-antitoxin system|nr:type II toxin-antitoxin system RelE/ParE family toxin [Pirellulales bacterium]